MSEFISVSIPGASYLWRPELVDELISGRAQYVVHPVVGDDGHVSAWAVLAVVFHHEADSPFGTRLPEGVAWRQVGQDTEGETSVSIYDTGMRLPPHEAYSQFL